VATGIGCSDFFATLPDAGFPWIMAGQEQHSGDQLPAYLVSPLIHEIGVKPEL
jgi:hypothetical protein